MSNPFGVVHKREYKRDASGRFASNNSDKASNDSIDSKSFMTLEGDKLFPGRNKEVQDDVKQTLAHLNDPKVAKLSPKDKSIWLQDYFYRNSKRYDRGSEVNYDSVYDYIDKEVNKQAVENKVKKNLKEPWWGEYA